MLMQWFTTYQLLSLKPLHLTLQQSVSLISMCLGVFLLGFILYGTLCASWTWWTTSFSMLGKFSTIISSKNFSYPFFSLLLGPLYFKCWCIWYCPRGLETILSSFFLLYSALQKLFPPFYLPAHWFVLLLQIFCYWFFQSIFNFSNCVVSVCLFFNSSMSLFTDSWIFSILFSRFLIIFTIIILNSFSDILPISSSFIWTSVFLVCSLICVVFLCLSYF